MNIKDSIFYLDVVVNYVLIFSVIWSIEWREKRVWTPPQNRSWQYLISR